MTDSVERSKSTYHELLEKCNYTTMLIRRIKTIAMEVFKSLHDLNRNFIKEMFNIKELKYSLRDSNSIYQPKFEKVTYGKNTFKYYRAHVWNLLPNEIKETADILSFKSLIMKWEDPICQCNMCNIFKFKFVYVMYTFVYSYHRKIAFS